MPKSTFISEIPQAGLIKGYDTNQGGKEVYVKPGFYTPGISATPYTPPTPKSDVGILSSQDGAKQIKDDKNYVDTTYPKIPPVTLKTPPTPTQIDTTLNENKTPEQSKLEGAVQVQNDKIESLINDFQNYNVDNDPAFQSQANSIKLEYNKLRSEMANTNYQRKRAYETLGMRTGSTRYAGDIQMGVEGEELEQGNERILDITRQEQTMLTAAKTAFETQKYTKYNQLVTSLKDLREIKAKELTNYNTKIADYTKKLQDEQKTLRDEQKKINDKIIQSSRDSAVADLVSQGVTNPTDMIDLLNFDENGKQIGNFTLEEVNKAMSYAINKDALSGLSADYKTYEYLKANQPDELKSLGVTNYQGYLKAINTAKDDAVADLMSKYPDAGIQPTDNLMTAQGKIQNSKIYQQATRLSGGTGGGGGGTSGIDKVAVAEDKEIKAFREDAAKMVAELEKQDGISWASAFDQLKIKYPQATNETINAILGGGIPYDATTGVFDTSKAYGRAKKK